MKEKIKEIKLPILFEEGRQLQLVKNNLLIASYDPVYKLNIINSALIIENNKYEYKHNLDDFDDIVVEEFELDEKGDRIFEGKYLKYYE